MSTIARLALLFGALLTSACATVSQRKTRVPASAPTTGPKNEAACTSGPACLSAGLAAQKKGAHGEALELLGRACALKSAVACLQLGNLASRGLGQPKRPQVALRRFEQACALGALRGCYNAGVCHYSGQGTAPAPKRAVPLFMRGCILGHGPSCYNAGVALHHGKGVPQDRRRARRMFLFGCQLGEKAACAQLPPSSRPAARD